MDDNAVCGRGLNIYRAFIYLHATAFILSQKMLNAVKLQSGNNKQLNIWRNL